MVFEDPEVDELQVLTDLIENWKVSIASCILLKASSSSEEELKTLKLAELAGRLVLKMVKARLDVLSAPIEVANES